MKALSIKNLKKTYEGGFEALKGISLDVEEGDFFALLGPNGAGKSTTIGIITSLVNKTSGSVNVFSYDINKDLTKAKTLIGIVPQEFNFNMWEPCIEILVNQAGYYGIERKEAFEKAEILLKQLDLWDKRQVQARSLSGGMKRRLMIARALIHKPKLLILDEPTAGVDIEIRRAMWDFIVKLNKSGTTIILTTHYLEEAEQLCKNIAIIDKGEIIENTSMKKLLYTLDKETFILDLKEKITSDKFKLLKKFNCQKIDDFTIEVQVSKKDSINSLFKNLEKNNIEVLSMRNKANRLEELFLDLTSKKGENK
ncbi:MAG: ABC transporter ATP-binding protein [Nanoarchaeota archaeon]|nr:ABC transporter ATP-binding protein [Nanoarchaeota archaeon]